MIWIVTTVGVSMFNNYRQHKPGDIDPIYNALEIKSAGEWESNQGRIEELRAKVGRWAHDDDNACAEIKSITKIIRQLKTKCIVRLLASDTILSRLAAEIIKDRLHGKEINGLKVEVAFELDRDVIPGLQVHDRKLFERTGLIELVGRMDLMYSDNVVFNITGGYKGTIPYLSLIAMVNSIPLYYIFEGTDELIRIPQVPIDINWSMFEKYAYVLEKLEQGILDWPQFKREHDIGEDFQACFWEEDGMAELNAIGRIFWERFKRFIRVKVPRGSHYFADKPGNRQQIETAVNQLHKRLTEIIKSNGLTSQKELLNFINGLGDTDLRHGANPARNLFIFKYTSGVHVRLVYRPRLYKNDLSLIICDYLRSNEIIHEDSKYIKDFARKWSDLTDNQIEDFVTVPIKSIE